jgi:hypothetical protein
VTSTQSCGNGCDITPQDHIPLDNRGESAHIGQVESEGTMMTLEQIKALDKQSDPSKLLPTTVAFLKEMREVSNFGRERVGLEAWPWVASDEARG